MYKNVKKWLIDKLLLFSYPDIVMLKRVLLLVLLIVLSSTSILLGLFFLDNSNFEILAQDKSQGQNTQASQSSRGKDFSVTVRAQNNLEKERINLGSTDRSLKIEDDSGTTFVSKETSSGVEQELTELENGESLKLDDATGNLEGLSLKSRGSKFVISQENLEATTKFPLSIDLNTNELIVTTPAGVKRVTVLPLAAIQNMIRVGHVDVILPQPSADPSTSPLPTDSATPSASIEPSPSATEGGELTTTEIASVEIIEEEGEVLYLVDGAKRKKLFGFFNVLVPKKVKISSQTGFVVDVEQTLGSTILDILSF